MYPEKDVNRKKGELCETKREGKQGGKSQLIVLNLILLLFLALLYTNSQLTNHKPYVVS